MKIEHVVKELQSLLSVESKHERSSLYNGNMICDYHIDGIVCADGVTMSVQASNRHLCEPCTIDGPYLSVEVGYPSVVIESFMDYIDCPDIPTNSIYGFVPIYVVAQAILDHGGFAEKF